MSWYRIEGGLPQHAKYAPLSDAAFRLAITAGCWCSEKMTDGRLPKAMVPALTKAPTGKRLDACVAALLDARIWEDDGMGTSGSFFVHDFLDWNMSRAQWEAKVEAAKAGGRAKAAKQLDLALPHGIPPGKPHGNGDGMPSALPKPLRLVCDRLPDSDSDSDSDLSEEKIPPTPRGGKRTGPTKAPETLEPTEATLAAATETGRDWRRDWVACRDWAWGAGKLKADWQATLRGWMRRAAEVGAGQRQPEKHGPGGGNGPQPNNPANRYVAPRRYDD